MYKSLYPKIVLILVVFIITVMSVVGVVLLNNMYSYYSNDFINQIEGALGEDTDLYNKLKDALLADDYITRQKETLLTYSSSLGIDNYRNYYILDADGGLLDSSDTKSSKSVEITPNILSAMQGKHSGEKSNSSFSDYAISVKNGDRETIIYVKDTQEDMQNLGWMLFTIILQSLFIGLVIAIIMAFFLSKAITAPIQNLTKAAKKVASGDFSSKIEVHSKDEIGVLTNTFNHMKKMLKTTIDEVSGERQKLETVFSHLQAGVITFSDEGKLLNINPFAVEILGDAYTESFNLTKLLNIFDINGAKEDDSSVKSIDESNVIFDEVIFGGRVLEVNFGGIRYRYSGDMKDGIITVIHDVSSRYELEKSRREFVANVSHELRTPLTAIKGACETILDHPELPDEIKNKFLEMSVNESNRMTGIVRDLLTLSRLDDKRTKWKISEYDICASLQNICDVMNVDATSHNHQLIFKGDEEIKTITADKERIEQVIINIVSNAIKYTPDGGTVIVNAAKIDKDNISIKIIDNGIGIPEADLARIFERFYRVEKARTSDTGGTGLGLAIAKELVEAHGGKISIQSKIGVGTIVTIVLPIKTKLENSDE